MKAYVLDFVLKLSFETHVKNKLKAATLQIKVIGGFNYNLVFPLLRLN